MKIYAAVTLADLTLSSIEDASITRVFPAGSEVSATEALQPGQWHLNGNGGAGPWDTYAGYAAAEQLELGEIIARLNE
jgi:hypothetical protein